MKAEIYIGFISGAGELYKYTSKAEFHKAITYWTRKFKTDKYMIDVHNTLNYR